MHILERGKDGGSKKEIKLFYISVVIFFLFSCPPVTYVGNSATTYFNPLGFGFILHFYCLHSFCYNIINITVAGLIYIPAQDKVRGKQEAL